MMAAFVAGGVVAAALILVGLWSLFDPHRSSHAYGLPAEGAHAHGFTRATGIRDLIIGAVLGAAVVLHDVPFIAVLAVAGIVLSIADFFIAYHGAGRRIRPAHANHLAGVIAFILVLAMALLAIGI